MLCIKTSPLPTALALAALTITGNTLAKQPLEQITVIADQLFKDTTLVSPSYSITEQDLSHINFTNVEDAIAHAPSLIVRKRFIGDPNGVIGIRGTNMFQGTRSMVFADGMPLHYHLQTRFSGSPRWSLVSPSEVGEVEVVYGPFSAEYSGNAMGGVVNIKTKTPSKQRLVVEASGFSQDYDNLATDETYNGGKLFVSYEDRIGDLGFFASYNRLLNQSQPQSQFSSSTATGNTGTEVNGLIGGTNEREKSIVYYGDSGSEQALSELYKLKLDYNLDSLQLRASIAYEQRERKSDDFNSFVTDLNGNKVFNGKVYSDNTITELKGNNFQHRIQDRDSLLVGLGVSGYVANSDWVFDSFYSNFQIIDDEEVRSARNPADPDFARENADFRGRITEYDDTGWQIADVKFATESFSGDERQRLSTGLHYDAYELNIIADDYNSIAGQRASDEVDGNRSTGRGDSGGEARTWAAFFQYGFAYSEQWDFALGLRYEDWQSDKGYNAGNNLAKRSEEGWSPKLSIAYFPQQDLSLRYSVARAIRFPIVEELFRNDGATSNGSVFLADPNLQPERGVFHNVSVEQQFDDGSISANFFYDQVNDVIFNQSTRTDTGTVTTSLPTDEVTTKGVEVVINQRNILNTALGVRFNASYIKAEITKNKLNTDIVGNEFPRQPRWRSNLVVSYPLTSHVDVSGNVRYASNSFGRLDNQDTKGEVFGAQDDYLFFGVKANWRVTDEFRMSFGVENITDETVYVFHPWPSRTVFLSGRYEFGG